METGKKERRAPGPRRATKLTVKAIDGRHCTRWASTATAQTCSCACAVASMGISRALGYSRHTSMASGAM